MFFTLDPLDVVTHDDGLLLIAIGRLERQSFAFVVLTEHILVDLSFVLPDQTVGCLYDILRTAVVLFQFEQSGTLVRLLEVKDIIDVRPAETIDALRIIPHHTDTLMLCSKLIHDALLYGVRILILVNQHKLETLCILPSHLLMLVEQHERLCEQIIKVHGIRLLAASAIS